MASVSNDAPWSIYAQLETTLGWVGRPEPFKALSRKFAAYCSIEIQWRLSVSLFEGGGTT